MKAHFVKTRKSIGELIAQDYERYFYLSSVRTKRDCFRIASRCPDELWTGRFSSKENHNIVLFIQQ